MLIGNIKQWLKLARLQSGAATAITPVYGAILLMSRDGIDTLHLMTLFIIGLLFHFYGFVLNEYSDIEIDRYSKDISDKPLITGAIKRKSALIAALIAIIVAVAVAVILFRNVNATLAFLIAIILGATYDLYGKRFFGADFVLGMSIFFFCIFGALTVSTNLNSSVILVAFLFFIQLSFQTGVTGGMKDIPHDYIAGAKTSPVYLGCRVVGKKLIITKGLRVYAFGTKAVHTLVVILPFWMGFLELYDALLIQFVILLLLISLMWATTIKALTLRIFDRLKLMRLLGMQEIFTYPIVPILIMGVVGARNAMFLLLFPIIWLACFLYIIYGKFMPDV